MGVLEWLGLGGRRGAAIPTVVLSGTHLAACKRLIREIAAGLDPALRISAVLYDTHDGIHAFAAPDNVRVVGCVGKDGATACACHGEGIERVSVGVRTAVRRDSPEVICLQVGRGTSGREVFGDLRGLGALVRVVNATTVLRAASALSDLSDGEGDPATQVCGSGYVWLTQVESVSDDVCAAVRRRVAELNPQAVVLTDAEDARKTIVGALGGLGSKNSRPC